eukprot:TRINITY_DN35325_c0_g1_i1.p1 TRINITY_DN35325_c0_g1~~TRINITY_DN35325_c0_g1_i1.p1  ORF type:complete len:467 (+),score=76.70 TRINITY_DN35325_c0_g1_i1:45-1445(+)
MHPTWKFGDVGALLVHRSNLKMVKNALRNAIPSSKNMGKRSGVKGWYNMNAATWLVHPGSEYFYIGVSSAGAAALQGVEGHPVPDSIKDILSVTEWKPGLRREAPPDDAPEPCAVENAKFTFTDLFAGIGGFRLGGEAVGGLCMYSVEKDLHSRKVYCNNFGAQPQGRDITQVDRLPAHDILTGGFPCGPFTLAAGPNRQGFSDPRGLLYLQIARLLEVSKPKSFLLENVPGIQRESVLIRKSLEEAGYDVKFFLKQAGGVVPQDRRRALFVGFRRDLGLGPYTPPPLPDFGRTVKNILERQLDVAKYVIDKELLDKILNSNLAQSRGKNRIADPMKRVGTLQSSYRSNPVAFSQFVQGDGYVRFFTERECARAQGFPDTFALCPARPYYHIGNAFPPPLASILLHSIASHLKGDTDQQVWLPGWAGAARLVLQTDENPEEAKSNVVTLPEGGTLTLQQLSEICTA